MGNVLQKYIEVFGMPPSILPDGAEIISTDSFFIATEYPEDTFVEEVVVRFKNTKVKILRYDEDSNSIFVCIGKRVKSLSDTDISDYMIRNIS